MDNEKGTKTNDDFDIAWKTINELKQNLSKTHKKLQDAEYHRKPNAKHPPIKRRTVNLSNGPSSKKPGVYLHPAHQGDRNANEYNCTDLRDNYTSYVHKSVSNNAKEVKTVNHYLVSPEKPHHQREIQCMTEDDQQWWQEVKSPPRSPPRLQLNHKETHKTIYNYSYKSIQSTSPFESKINHERLGGNYTSNQPNSTLQNTDLKWDKSPSKSKKVLDHRDAKSNIVRPSQESLMRLQNIVERQRVEKYKISSTYKKNEDHIITPAAISESCTVFSQPKTPPKRIIASKKHAHSSQPFLEEIPYEITVPKVSATCSSSQIGISHVLEKPKRIQKTITQSKSIITPQSWRQGQEFLLKTLGPPPVDKSKENQKLTPDTKKRKSKESFDNQIDLKDKPVIKRFKKDAKLYQKKIIEETKVSIKTKSYDPKTVQQFMAKKKKERQKCKEEANKKKSEENQQKKQRLQELYEFQRLAAHKSAKFSNKKSHYKEEDFKEVEFDVSSESPVESWEKVSTTTNNQSESSFKELENSAITPTVPSAVQPQSHHLQNNALEISSEDSINDVSSEFHEKLVNTVLPSSDHLEKSLQMELQRRSTVDALNKFNNNMQSVLEIMDVKIQPARSSEKVKDDISPSPCLQIEETIVNQSRDASFCLPCSQNIVDENQEEKKISSFQVEPDTCADCEKYSSCPLPKKSKASKIEPLDKVESHSPEHYNYSKQTNPLASINKKSKSAEVPISQNLNKAIKTQSSRNSCKMKVASKKPQTICTTLPKHPNLCDVQQRSSIETDLPCTENANDVPPLMPSNTAKCCMKSYLESNSRMQSIGNNSNINLKFYLEILLEASKNSKESLQIKCKQLKAFTPEKESCGPVCMIDKQSCNKNSNSQKEFQLKLSNSSNAYSKSLNEIEEKRDSCFSAPHSTAFTNKKKACILKKALSSDKCGSHMTLNIVAESVDSDTSDDKNSEDNLGLVEEDKRVKELRALANSVDSIMMNQLKRFGSTLSSKFSSLNYQSVSSSDDAQSQPIFPVQASTSNNRKSLAKDNLSSHESSVKPKSKPSTEVKKQGLSSKDKDDPTKTHSTDLHVPEKITKSVYQQTSDKEIQENKQEEDQRLNDLKHSMSLSSLDSLSFKTKDTWPRDDFKHSLEKCSNEIHQIFTQMDPENFENKMDPYNFFNSWKKKNEGLFLASKNPFDMKDSVIIPEEGKGDSPVVSGQEAAFEISNYDTAPNSSLSAASVFETDNGSLDDSLSEGPLSTSRESLISDIEEGRLTPQNDESSKIEKNQLKMSPNTLGMAFQTELAYLDTIQNSLQHVTELNRLHEVASSQQENQNVAERFKEHLAKQKEEQELFKQTLEDKLAFERVQAKDQKDTLEWVLKSQAQTAQTTADTALKLSQQVMEPAHHNITETATLAATSALLAAMEHRNKYRNVTKANKATSYSLHSEGSLESKSKTLTNYTTLVSETENNTSNNDAYTAITLSSKTTTNQKDSSITEEKNISGKDSSRTSVSEEFSKEKTQSDFKKDSPTAKSTVLNKSLERLGGQPIESKSASSIAEEIISKFSKTLEQSVPTNTSAISEEIVEMEKWKISEQSSPQSTSTVSEELIPGTGTSKSPEQSSTKSRPISEEIISAANADSSQNDKSSEQSTPKIVSTLAEEIASKESSSKTITENIYSSFNSSQSSTSLSPGQIEPGSLQAPSYSLEYNQSSSQYKEFLSSNLDQSPLQQQESTRMSTTISTATEMDSFKHKKDGLEDFIPDTSLSIDQMNVKFYQLALEIDSIRKKISKINAAERAKGDKNSLFQKKREKYQLEYNGKMFRLHQLQSEMNQKVYNKSEKCKVILQKLELSLAGEPHELYRPSTQELIQGISSAASLSTSPSSNNTDSYEQVKESSRKPQEKDIQDSKQKSIQEIKEEKKKEMEQTILELKESNAKKIGEMILEIETVQREEMNKRALEIEKNIRDEMRQRISEIKESGKIKIQEIQEARNKKMQTTLSELSKTWEKEMQQAIKDLQEVKKNEMQKKILEYRESWGLEMSKVISKLKEEKVLEMQEKIKDIQETNKKEIQKMVELEAKSDESLKKSSSFKPQRKKHKYSETFKKRQASNSSSSQTIPQASLPEEISQSISEIIEPGSDASIPEDIQDEAVSNETSPTVKVSEKDTASQSSTVIYSETFESLGSNKPDLSSTSKIKEAPTFKPPLLTNLKPRRRHISSESEDSTFISHSDTDNSDIEGRVQALRQEYSFKKKELEIVKRRLQHRQKKKDLRMEELYLKSQINVLGTQMEDIQKQMEQTIVHPEILKNVKPIIKHPSRKSQKKDEKTESGKLSSRDSESSQHEEARREKLNSFKLSDHESQSIHTADDSEISNQSFQQSPTSIIKALDRSTSKSAQSSFEANSSITENIEAYESSSGSQQINNFIDPQREPRNNHTFTAAAVEASNTTSIQSDAKSNVTEEIIEQIDSGSGNIRSSSLITVEASSQEKVSEDSYTTEAKEATSDSSQPSVKSIAEPTSLKGHLQFDSQEVTSKSENAFSVSAAASVVEDVSAILKTQEEDAVPEYTSSYETVEEEKHKTSSQNESSIEEVISESQTVTEDTSEKNNFISDRQNDNSLAFKPLDATTSKESISTYSFGDKSEGSFSSIKSKSTADKSEKTDKESNNENQIESELLNKFQPAQTSASVENKESKHFTNSESSVNELEFQYEDTMISEGPLSEYDENENIPNYDGIVDEISNELVNNSILTIQTIRGKKRGESKDGIQIEWVVDSLLTTMIASEIKTVLGIRNHKATSSTSNVSKKIQSIMSSIKEDKKPLSSHKPQDLMKISLDDYDTALEYEATVANEYNQEFPFDQVHLTGIPEMSLTEQDWYIEDDYGLISPSTEDEILAQYYREIPNKPPPPYTPPKTPLAFKPVVPEIVVPHTRQEIQEIVDRIAGNFYDSYHSGVPFKDFPKLDRETSEQTIEGNLNESRKEDYNHFLHDLVLEVTKDSYRVKPDAIPALVTFSKLAKTKPLIPDSKDEFIGEIQMKIQRLMKFDPPTKKNEKWRQKLGHRRRDFIDQILIQEIRDEDKQWTTYDEDNVKKVTADLIFDDLLQDAVRTFQMLCKPVSKL